MLLWLYLLTWRGGCAAQRLYLFGVERRSCVGSIFLAWRGYVALTLSVWRRREAA